VFQNEFYAPTCSKSLLLCVGCLFSSQLEQGVHDLRIKSSQSTQIFEEQQALYHLASVFGGSGYGPRRFQTFICPIYKFQHQCAQRGGSEYGPQRFQTLGS
jgi:hypothetical protein